MILKQKGQGVTRNICILGNTEENHLGRVSIFQLATLLNQDLHHEFWPIRTIILQDNYEQDPFLSASVAVFFFPDETQHSYSLGKSTDLKISKPFCFNFCNFTLSQSAGCKPLEKDLCGSKFNWVQVHLSNEFYKYLPFLLFDTFTNAF